MNIINVKIDKITNFLLERLSKEHVQEIGLYGQMGFVLFLYLYSRKSQNKQLEKHANRLLDDVVKIVEDGSSVSFYYGVTGIGWGIEYLSQCRLLDIDTDMILKEIDNILLNSKLQRISVHIDHHVFDYGIYFLMRTKKDIKIPLVKRQILTFLVEECVLMLSRDFELGEKIPILNLHLLNSILYFLIESHKLGISKKNTEKALFSNLFYIKSVLTSESVILSDCIVNAHLLKNIPFSEQYHESMTQYLFEINEMLDDKIKNMILERKELSNIAWASIMYDLNIEDDRVINLINDMMNDISNIPKNVLLNTGLILLESNK